MYVYVLQDNLNKTNQLMTLHNFHVLNTGKSKHFVSGSENPIDLLSNNMINFEGISLALTPGTLGQFSDH